MRTFLEPKAPQSTYLKCTTRFVQCHLHSYTTDVNMYMNPNAEMTFNMFRNAPTEVNNAQKTRGQT